MDAAHSHQYLKTITNIIQHIKVGCHAKYYNIKILNLWYINGKLKVSYTDFDKDTKMTIKYVVNQYYFTF